MPDNGKFCFLTSHSTCMPESGKFCFECNINSVANLFYSELIV